MKTITISTVTVATATGTLTASGAVSDGDTVTIGTKTYTFKNSLVPVPIEGQVLINGSAANALLNLKAAINHLGTEFPNNTNYYCAAAHTQVQAGALTSTTLALAALSPGTDGNAIATTETGANLAFGSATLTGGANTISMSGTWADVTPSSVSQQVTVGEFPANNTAWSRGHRITNTAIQCIRSFVQAGMYLTSWAKIATALERTLSYVPKINTQPAAASCVHSSTAAVFTVVDSSEITETYQWQYSLDGLTLWANATGTINGCAYTNDTTASLTCTPTTTGQNGYYHRCQITNANGTSTTDAAVLTIT